MTRGLQLKRPDQPIFNKDDNKVSRTPSTQAAHREQLFRRALFVTPGAREIRPASPLGTRAVPNSPTARSNHFFRFSDLRPAPPRMACECEREGEANLAQALQLINGPAVNTAPQSRNRIGKLLAKKLDEPAPSW